MNPVICDFLILQLWFAANTCQPKRISEECQWRLFLIYFLNFTHNNELSTCIMWFNLSSRDPNTQVIIFCNLWVMHKHINYDFLFYHLSHFFNSFIILLFYLYTIKINIKREHGIEIDTVDKKSVTWIL